MSAGPDWAEGLKETPFWHEAAPPEADRSAQASEDVPEQTDVAIVGAGFTGLSAALALAREGRRVTVLDRGPPGAGASTRNGGMLGWGHRVSLKGLAKRHGAATAGKILAEAAASLAFTRELIAELPVDARHRLCGRFLGAGSELHFRRLATWAEQEAPDLGMRVEVVGPGEQDRFIATELYRGGIHFPDHGAVHPALFHRGVLEAARAAGATIVGHCEVRSVAGGPGDWSLSHARGALRANQLVFAGNGYAGPGVRPFPAFAKRLLPIPSFIIATERLGSNRMESLLPGGRCIVETRASHAYFRPDPDGERLLWGGRASLVAMAPRRSAARLRDQMLSVFPELADVRLTHSWTGNVAFTSDGVAHTGQLDGIWYACGYNGSGVAMAPYLGWKLAERIVGRTDVRTGFDEAPFRAKPFGSELPGALLAVEAYYRIKERLEGVKPIRRARS